MIYKYITRFFLTALMMLVSFTFFPFPAHAGETKTISILPFETIAAEDISYVQTGTLRMLHSRMAWKERVNVIPMRTIEEQLKAIDTTNKNQIIQTIAKNTKSDYVLTGSITQFSSAFSIDTRIYDIQNRRYLSFSDQSKILSELIPKVNFIAAKINKKVFNRKTVVYDQLVKTEKDKIEELRRQNPERLMPDIPKTDPSEKSSPWKFWEYL